MIEIPTVEHENVENSHGTHVVNNGSDVHVSEGSPAVNEKCQRVQRGAHNDDSQGIVGNNEEFCRLSLCWHCCHVRGHLSNDVGGRGSGVSMLLEYASYSCSFSNTSTDVNVFGMTEEHFTSKHILENVLLNRRATATRQFCSCTVCHWNEYSIHPIEAGVVRLLVLTICLWLQCITVLGSKCWRCRVFKKWTGLNSNYFDQPASASVD